MDAINNRNNTCRDYQVNKEEDEITHISSNANRLYEDKWKEKNNNLHNFLYQIGAKIITLQEININQKKIKSNE